MARAKLILILVFVLLTVIIVLQNSQAVETRILFLTVTMPRSVLLFLTALAGFFLGVMVSLAITRGGKKRDRTDQV